jgi:hypothetical protein
MGLLWYVLHVFHDECVQGCVGRMLAWGTCPHVYSMKDSVMAGVMARKLPVLVMQQLMDYGTCPWGSWGMLGCRRRSTAISWYENVMMCQNDAAFFQHAGLSLSDVRMQFRRWHARLRKRQWLTRAMTHTDTRYK